MTASAIRTPAVHEADRDLTGDSGVEGNARLTAALGMLLTLLLLAEGVTILSVRQLITAHIAIGLVLLAPVAVKIGTTTYRFARYYLTDEAYVRRGPPPLVLRWIGPLVIVSTVALLGTGVALLLRRPDDAGSLLTLHKASFIGWAVLMTIHFLGHVVEAARLAVRDVSSQRSMRRSGPVAVSASLPGGRRLRLITLVLTLVAGVATAAAITPGNHWSVAPPHHEQRGDGPRHHRH